MVCFGLITFFLQETLLLGAQGEWVLNDGKAHSEEILFLAKKIIFNGVLHVLVAVLM